MNVDGEFPGSLDARFCLLFQHGTFVLPMRHRSVALVVGRPRRDNLMRRERLIVQESSQDRQKLVIETDAQAELRVKIPVDVGPTLSVKPGFPLRARDYSGGASSGGNRRRAPPRAHHRRHPITAHCLRRAPPGPRVRRTGRPPSGSSRGARPLAGWFHPVAPARHERHQPERSETGGRRSFRAASSTTRSCYRRE